jgi:hypothetical protein
MARGAAGNNDAIVLMMRRRLIGEAKECVAVKRASINWVSDAAGVDAWTTYRNIPPIVLPIALPTAAIGPPMRRRA